MVALVNRCESCSDKLGALSVLFVRGEVDRAEWCRRAYQGVHAHHPDWALSAAWGFAKVRAPFYPFREPDPVVAQRPAD